MFVGPIVNVTTLTEGCHNIDLVRPNATAADDYRSAIELIDPSMSELQLSVGYNQTTLIVYPGTTHGFARDSDAVIGAEWRERMSASGMPIHEYIYTRQSLELQSEMMWFFEASTTYHTARYLYREGHITTSEYNGYLSYIDQQAGNATLFDPDRWNRQTDYHAGMVVMAHLDQDLRAAGNATVLDIVYKMNQHDREYSLSAFEATLGEHGLELNQSFIECTAAYRASPLLYAGCSMFRDANSGEGNLYSDI